MRIALEASRTAAQSSTIKADEAHNAKKNLSVRFHKLQEQVKLLEDAVAVEKSERMFDSRLISTLRFLTSPC